MTKQPKVKNEAVEQVNGSSKGWTTYVPYIIAVGVLIAYGFFISFLIGKVDQEEPDWSRLIYLFSGVEAIVFAAAGFLFGREVNRKRAENAEEGRKKADKQKEEDEKQAVEERSKGLILGTMCVQEARASSGATDQRAALEGTQPIQNGWNSIAEKARSMYPELTN